MSKKNFIVKTKPSKCSFCGSSKVVPILYGLYEPTLEDMVEAAKPDYVQKFALGGCVTTGHDPKWQCLDCETKYYEEK